jgi:hypothetical protein
VSNHTTNRTRTGIYTQQTHKISSYMFRHSMCIIMFRESS